MYPNLKFQIKKFKKIYNNNHYNNYYNKKTKYKKTKYKFNAINRT